MNVIISAEEPGERSHLLRERRTLLDKEGEEEEVVVHAVEEHQAQQQQEEEEQQEANYNDTTAILFNNNNNNNNEFVLSPVQEDSRVSWIRVSILFISGSFSLPSFVAGIDIIVFGLHHHQYQYQWQDSIMAILVGNLLVAFVTSLCGIVGTKTGLNSYALSQIAFGKNASKILNGAFAISLLGWFGFNLNIYTTSMLGLLLLSSDDNDNDDDHDDNGQTASTITPDQNHTLSYWIPILGGLVMTLTAMCGFHFLVFIAPILAGVTILFLVKSFYRAKEIIMDSTTEYEHNIIELLLSSKEEEEEESLVPAPNNYWTLGEAISSVVGVSIIGAIIAPDYMRFVRTWPGAIYVALLCALATSLVEFSSALASLVFHEQDLLHIMESIGLKNEAIVILVAGTWIVNAMNLYSLALNLEVTFGMDSNHHHHHFAVVLVLGALGTLVGFCNLLDQFLVFLFCLSIIFVPVAGVIVMDYAVVSTRCGHVHHEENYISFLRNRRRPTFRPTAILAWVLGTTIAALGSTNVMKLTSIPALDAFVVASISYFALLSFSRTVQLDR